MDKRSFLRSHAFLKEAAEPEAEQTVADPLDAQASIVADLQQLHETMELRPRPSRTALFSCFCDSSVIWIRTRPKS